MDPRLRFLFDSIKARYTIGQITQEQAQKEAIAAATEWAINLQYN